MPRNRTAELSFREVNDECVDQLLEGTGIVVLKDSLPLDTETGVRTAYHAARKRMLHRRLTARAMAGVGLGGTKLYRLTQAPPVKADPRELPKHMRTARPAVDALLDVHGQFAEQTKVLEIYGGALEQNLALFGLSLKGNRSAFPRHQDNQGKAGIAEAAQFDDTQWTIYRLSGIGPTTTSVVPDYTFLAERGDVVVLAERTGPAPSVAPTIGTGEHVFYQDGSPIHEGMKLYDGDRYGLGLFNEQVE